MKTDNSKLFELVEPPADGEKALRARLLLDEQGRTDWRWGLAAACTVVGAIAILVAQPWNSNETEHALQAEIYDAREFSRLLGREFEPYELRVTLNTREAAVIEVASSDPKIRLYLIN